jgi:hypothetical protein
VENSTNTLSPARGNSGESTEEDDSSGGTTKMYSIEMYVLSGLVIMLA